MQEEEKGETLQMDCETFGGCKLLASGARVWLRAPNLADQGASFGARGTGMGGGGRGQMQAIGSESTIQKLSSWLDER